MSEVQQTSRWSFGALVSALLGGRARAPREGSQPSAPAQSPQDARPHRSPAPEPDRFARGPVAPGAPLQARGEATAATTTTSPIDVRLSVKVDDIRAAVPPEAPAVERRIALFKAIAATVPFDVPDGRNRVMPTWAKEPWEDRRDRSLAAVRETVPLAEVLGVAAARARGGDTFLRAWAESSRAELWETPVGKGFAHFALHRYGGALTHDHNDKFGHAALVMAHADAIANEQAQRGCVLPEEWRQVIEYGGLLHDVGYMFGGDRHPSKGTLDLLINGPAYLAQLGVTVDRKQLERIAVAMMLHGATFPWGDLDGRLPGDHYVDANLVFDVLKAKKLELARILMQDLGPYVALGKNERRLDWLTDPHEMELLIKTGWMLHCADKYCGPYKDMRRAGVTTLQELDGVEGVGRASRGPIATVEELDKHGSMFGMLGLLTGGGRGAAPAFDVGGAGLGSERGPGSGFPRF